MGAGWRPRLGAPHAPGMSWRAGGYLATKNKGEPLSAAPLGSIIGAGEEIRTLDPLVGNEMLYH